MSQSTPKDPDFPALPRISCRVLTRPTEALVTALWENLELKTQFPVSMRREA